MSRTSIDYETHRVSEVFMDLPREAVQHIAKREGVDYVIIRVQVFGPNGRPASRTLRLHKDLLEEPPAGSEYDPFN